jgi:cholesterol transport system auxiliary component
MNAAIQVFRSVRTARAMLAALGMVLSLSLALSACISGGRTAPAAQAYYDLGTIAAQSAAGNLPPVKVPDMIAPSSLDSEDMVYRIGAQQVAHYANSHWVMPPARLLTQALRDTLAAGSSVLSGGDVVNAPVLKTELAVFSQRFASATVSEGVVSVRATLLSGGRVLAQRTFSVAEPAASPDAAGGAQALARASSRVAQQIAMWLSGVLPRGEGHTRRP